MTVFAILANWLTSLTLWILWKSIYSGGERPIPADVTRYLNVCHGGPASIHHWAGIWSWQSPPDVRRYLNDVTWTSAMLAQHHWAGICSWKTCQRPTFFARNSTAYAIKFIYLIIYVIYHLATRPMYNLFIMDSIHILSHDVNFNLNEVLFV